MSIHATNPELEKRLADQRRNATLTSVIVALLGALLLGLLLAFILIKTRIEVTPEIVTYGPQVTDDDVIEEPEIQNMVERKPASPSSSMAKVIAANTASPISVPVVDVPVDTPSLDFGDGNDFGDGWGNGGGGNGAGGGGGATFFQQKVTAERICFVIDYSASMRGPRIELLKKELAKSVKGLPSSVQYQLIFFAGPAWVAGDKIKLDGKKSAVVKNDGREYKWRSGGGAHDWDTSGTKLRPSWKQATKASVTRSLREIKNTDLVWGTDWEHPLEMALDMKESPNVIFFMTDGLSGGRSMDIAKSISRKAARRDIVINSIALMEPSAGAAMEVLAAKTGGSFTMVDRDGSVKTILKSKDKDK